MIEGGVLQNVISDTDIECSLIDHDALETGEGPPDVDGVAVDVNPTDVNNFYADPSGYAGYADDYELSEGT